MIEPGVCGRPQVGVYPLCDCVPFLSKVKEGSAAIAAKVNTATNITAKRLFFTWLFLLGFLLQGALKRFMDFCESIQNCCNVPRIES
jgi:hypothetical protein